MGSVNAGKDRGSGDSGRPRRCLREWTLWKFDEPMHEDGYMVLGPSWDGGIRPIGYVSKEGLAGLRMAKRLRSAGKVTSQRTMIPALNDGYVQPWLWGVVMRPVDDDGKMIRDKEFAAGIFAHDPSARDPSIGLFLLTHEGLELHRRFQREIIAGEHLRRNRISFLTTLHGDGCRPLFNDGDYVRCMDEPSVHGRLQIGAEFVVTTRSLQVDGKLVGSSRGDLVFRVGRRRRMAIDRAGIVRIARVEALAIPGSETKRQWAAKSSSARKEPQRATPVAA